MPDASVMEQIVSLCKRRAFIYPASEIYGGLNGFWDYGPLGCLLKNNIRDWWWHEMVLCPPLGPDGHPIEMVGLDSSIIQNPKTWVASGHAGGFSDPMVDCRESKQRYRPDHLRVLGYTPEANAGMMFAYVQGDEESLDRAKKKLEKRYKISFPSAEAFDNPLTKFDVSHYARVVGPFVTVSR